MNNTPHIGFGKGALIQLGLNSAPYVDVYFTGNPQNGVWIYGSDRKKQKASSNPNCPSLAYAYLEKDPGELLTGLYSDLSVYQYNDEIKQKQNKKEQGQEQNKYSELLQIQNELRQNQDELHIQNELFANKKNEILQKRNELIQKQNELFLPARPS